MNKLSVLSVDRQKQVQAGIRVLGVDDWRECLEGTIKLTPPWSRICGGEEVLLLEYLGKEAEVNGVSFERCVVNELLNKGFCLEELEVEFTNPDQAKWGRAVWIKDYPYPNKIEEDHFIPIKSVYLPSFYYARFSTEKEGIQEFCLYSTQFGSGILLHKSIVFHRVVFSPPH